MGKLYFKNILNLMVFLIAEVFFISIEKGKKIESTINGKIYDNVNKPNPLNNIHKK
tara:strand:+ start:153 stop:320 length:168 start_codon:yes stop_codon:yes gene_type:complete